MLLVGLCIVRIIVYVQEDLDNFLNEFDPLKFLRVWKFGLISTSFK